MNAVRTLPIRIAPIEGEAIDSWLEAIAYRTSSAFGDLLSAVGLGTRDGQGTQTTSAWIVQLTPNEMEAVGRATGIDEPALESMTLAHYSDRAIRINCDSRTLNRAFPWARACGSRYCPACLDESEGRWQLAWRLGWTFACARHHCLLADACPQCGAVQRRRPPVVDSIPKRGHCAHPSPDAIGRTPARCGADLTATAVARFNPDHPVIRAQQIVNAVIAEATAKFGLYETLPQPRISVLADIRAVASRVLSHATPSDLDAVVPADLLACYREVTNLQARRSGPARTDSKPGLAAPARAATAALGLVAALQALDNREIADAGDALRWLISSSRERRYVVSPTNMSWGKGTSPVLATVQLAALGPLLKPRTQLRYRVGSAIPTQPTQKTTPTIVPAHRVPAMLWPAWSLALSIPNCHQRQLRPVLSIALLLVNSRRNVAEIAAQLDSPANCSAVSRVMRYLGTHDRWPGIRAGLVRMADHLVDHGVPIDYERRRRLDYSTLLPDQTWARICRTTATPGPTPTRANIVRCFLFARLSGHPADRAPTAVDDNAFRTNVADFPRYLTPELSQSLDHYSLEFLAAQGVNGEPVAWCPPASVLDGLRLPKCHPDDIDIANLHVAHRVEGKRLGAVSEAIETSLDTVRYLLELHPAPRPEQRPGATRVRGLCYYQATTELPRGRFVDLYQQQGMSLSDIAATIGVGRSTVTRLAHDYEIKLREPVHRARTTIERDWLYDQYVNKRRALPDIAEETGMSTANMARWAKTHAIPLRARGGASHSTTLAAERAADLAPDLIGPALAGIGGRERLERFAAATRYSTLTVAADKLGVHQFTLVNQINRIERELDTKLLIRAERGHPMKLTDDGARVLATVRACQRKGW